MYRFYDFTCESCAKEERLACWADKIHDQKCKCGGDLISESERVKAQAPNYIPFKAGWYEHFTSEPIYIKNKQELKKACKDHNMGSVYRDDM